MKHSLLFLLVAEVGLGAALASPALQSSDAEPRLLPAGTVLRVRTSELIDVDSSRAGAKFRGTLDDPVMLSGEAVVPRGADVELVAAKVEQGGKMKGSDLIQL